MLLIVRELGGIRLGKEMIPHLPKELFMWLVLISLMIKESQTLNMDLRCPVKMGELL